MNKSKRTCRANMGEKTHSTICKSFTINNNKFDFLDPGIPM